MKKKSDTQVLEDGGVHKAFLIQGMRIFYHRL